MQILLVIVLCMSALSCGVDKFSARSPAARGSFGGEVRPPVDYYRALLATRFNAKHKSTPHGTVFLNFGGGEVFRGFDKKESFLPCNKKVVVSPASMGRGEQESIYDELAEFFNAEDVPLDVVMDEPLAGDYSTVHIGGWYHSLGCRGQPVLGSAPSDHGNVHPADIGFVFNAELELLTAATAHVIGRMIGLPLQNQADDTIMGRHIDNNTPLVLNEQARQILRTQHTAAARIAADELPGNVLVSAIGAVLDEIEQDEVLDISALQAELRLSVPEEVTLPGLARSLTAIHMLGLDGYDFKKSSKWGKVKDVLTDVLKETVIKSVKKPRDVRDNVTAAIADVLGDAWGKRKNDSKNRQHRRLTALPNLTALLELDHLTASAQLFPLLQAQRQLIERDFSGAEYDSMQSLLKVGYFQRLAELP